MDLITRVLVEVGLDAHAARFIAPQIRQEYLDITYWHAYQDSRDALAAAAQHGFRNCILSNHVPELAQIVNGVGLGALIDGVFSSGLLGFEKPNPENL